MTIYTQLEDNLEKLKLTAIKEYLPNYLNNNDLSLAEALEQLTAKERVSIILCTFENPSLYEMLT